MRTTTILLRLSTRLALTRSPEHVWRQVAVPVAAFVFMISLILMAGTLLMTERQEDRDLARRLVFSSTARASDAFTRTGLDMWRGERITVIWVERPARVTEAVLPPGMSSFPGPGEAVVSPALARLADRFPELAGRYPHRDVLGFEGVRTGGELLAYVRPVDNRGIGGTDEAVHLEGGDLVGRDVYRVSRLGPVAALGDGVPQAQLLAGLLVCLAIPSTLVLGAGFSTTSRIRDHRLQVLRGLGAGRSQLAVLAVLETFVLALPAILLACLVWAVWSPSAASIPFVGQALVPGDLVLPGWLWMPLVVLGCVVAVVVALVVTRAGRREAATNRPVSGRSESSWLTIGPLAASALAFMVAALFPHQTDLAGNAQLAGVALAGIGIPLVVPSCLRAVGSAMSRSPKVVPALVGHSLWWDPTRAARPFAGVAALLVIGLALSGVYAIGESVVAEYRADATAESGVHGANVVSVAWEQPRRLDSERLVAALPAATVLPYRMAPHVDSRSGDLRADPDEQHADEHGGALALNATCADLARVLEDLSCRRARTLPDPVRSEFAAEVSRATGHKVERIRLVPGTFPAPSGRVLVLGHAGLASLDEDVRDAAYQTLPAPQIGSDVGRLYPPPQAVYGWILLGLGVVFFLLLLAAVLSLVDRKLAEHRQNLVLVNLGASPGTLARLGAAFFAVPYAVTTVLGVVTGLILCTMLLDAATGLPWRFISSVVFPVVGLGVVGTLAVARFGARSALREPE